MDKLEPAEEQLSSARKYLTLILRDQQAATEELQASNQELAAILEQFLTARGEPRAAAGEFADGNCVPLAVNGLSVDGHRPKAAAEDLELAQLQDEADRALRMSRRAVHESTLLRQKSTRVRLALRATDGTGALSKRERQVLALIVAGKSSKQVAADLGISFKTAVTHRASIMGKLDVHEIASMVREAIRRGLA